MGAHQSGPNHSTPIGKSQTAIALQPLQGLCRFFTNLVLSADGCCLAFAGAKRRPVGWPIFLCARPSSRPYDHRPEGRGMNEEDREWGPDAVRLWKEWLNQTRAIQELQKIRPLDREKFAEEYQKLTEKFAAFERAVAEYRERNGLPPLPFCPH